MTNIRGWSDEEIREATLDPVRFKSMLENFEDAYWRLNTPLVDDYTYDHLKRTYTQRYGVEEKELVTPILDGLEIDLSDNPMKSIANAFTQKEYLNWVKRSSPGKGDYLYGPKVDGLAIRLFYIVDPKVPGRYNLTCASTRGDSLTGSDVTDSFLSYVSNEVRTFDCKQLGLSIRDLPNQFHLDTEVYCPLSTFYDYNQHEDTIKYSTPRHLASALMTSTLKGGSVGKLLRCVVHGVDVYVWTTLSEAFGYLRKVFDCIPHEVSDDPNRLWDMFVNISPNDPTYMPNTPKDGYVVRLNDISAFTRCGTTESVYRGSIALKRNDAVSITTVRDVEWSISGQGLLTPVLQIDPTDIGGVSVTRVNLHGYRQYRNYHFKPGDEVGVVLSGGVIPEIEDVRAPDVSVQRGPAMAPSTCTQCGQPTILRDEKLYCSYMSNCKGALPVALVKVLGKHRLDVEGVGIVYTTWLVECEGVTSTAKLMDVLVEDNLDRLCDSYKKYTQRNVNRDALQQICKTLAERRKGIPLYRLILSLGIPGIGTKPAKDLAEMFPSLDDFIHAFVRQGHPPSHVPEITGRRIHAWMSNHINLQNALDFCDKVKASDK